MTEDIHSTVLNNGTSEVMLLHIHDCIYQDPEHLLCVVYYYNYGHAAIGHIICISLWRVSVYKLASMHCTIDYVVQYVAKVGHSCTVIWLYFTLKIFGTLLFRVVLISYAPHIVYETRVKMSLLNNIRSFNFRTDGSVRN